MTSFAVSGSLWTKENRKVLPGKAFFLIFSLSIFYQNSELVVKEVKKFVWKNKSAKIFFGNACQLRTCSQNSFHSKFIFVNHTHSRTRQVKIRGSCEVCRKIARKVWKKAISELRNFSININSLLNAKLPDVAIKHTRGGKLRVIQT